MPGARVAESERVTLRTVEREDVAVLQRAHADPDLRFPLGWTPKNQAKVEDGLEDLFGHDALFLACLDDAGPGQPGEDVTPVGSVFCGTGSRGRPGIGFWILPEFQGEGYGTEAASLLLEYVFATYAHPSVYAEVLPDNQASRSLLESLGFREEGRLRKDAFWEGRYRDAIVYGLLREEWAGRD